MEELKKRNWDDNPRGFFDAYFDKNNNAVCFFVSPLLTMFSFFSYIGNDVTEEQLTITGETIALFGELVFGRVEIGDKHYLKFFKKEVE